MNHKVWCNIQTGVTFIKITENLDLSDAYEMITVVRRFFKLYKCQHVICTFNGINDNEEERHIYESSTTDVLDYKPDLTIVSSANPVVLMMSEIILQATEQISKTRFFKLKKDRLAEVKG